MPSTEAELSAVSEDNVRLEVAGTADADGVCTGVDTGTGTFVATDVVAVGFGEFVVTDVVAVGIGESVAAEAVAEALADGCGDGVAAIPDGLSVFVFVGFCTVILQERV